MLEHSETQDKTQGKTHSDSPSHQESASKDTIVDQLVIKFTYFYKNSIPIAHCEKVPSRTCFKTDPDSIKGIINELTPKYPALTNLTAIKQKLQETADSENMELILREYDEDPERLLVVIRAKKNVQYESAQMSECNVSFFQDLIYAIQSADAL